MPCQDHVVLGVPWGRSTLGVLLCVVHYCQLGAFVPNTCMRPLFYCRGILCPDVLVAGHHITMVGMPLLLYFDWYLGSYLCYTAVIMHWFILCIIWAGELLVILEWHCHILRGFNFCVFPLSLYQKGDCLWPTCCPCCAACLPYATWPRAGCTLVGVYTMHAVSVSLVCCGCCEVLPYFVDCLLWGTGMDYEFPGG